MLNIIQKPYNFSKNLWSLPFKRASDNVETKAKQTLTKKWKSEKKVYELNHADLYTFALSGMPFLTFDEFLNIVKWYRDGYYAGSNVKGFSNDVGRKYSVWTRHTVSNYYRHVVLEEIIGDLYLSFEIPDLNRRGSFPLLVKLYDEGGDYFVHQQELAVERFVNDRFVLSSWAKVPPLSEFLKSQCKKV